MKPCSRMSGRASTGPPRRRCATSGAAAGIFAWATLIGRTRTMDRTPRSPEAAGTLRIRSLSYISTVTCASRAPTWRESFAAGRMVPSSLSLERLRCSFRQRLVRLITSTSLQTRAASPPACRTSPAAVSSRGNDASVSALRRGIQETQELLAEVPLQMLRRTAKNSRGSRVREPPR
jgi:hypothetical protein